MTFYDAGWHKIPIATHLIYIKWYLPDGFICSELSCIFSAILAKSQPYTHETQYIHTLPPRY